MRKENLEEYMELFYEFERAGVPIRTSEVARELGVTKGNVSQALPKLEMDKLITHKPYGDIKLTSKGEVIGKDVCAKHNVTERFLTDVLKVEPKIAHLEACGIEHAISKETLKKLSRFMEPHNEKQ